MKLYQNKEFLINQIKIKTYSQIAKENNIDISTIFRNLKKFGLTKKFKKWTKEELQLLKKEYLHNPKVHELFKNRTKSSVYHKASKFKIKKEIRKSKHKVNQYFFTKWSIKMAYLFGWFCSDGYVASNSNCVGFHINKKDISILKKIKKNLSSSHPIGKDKDGISFRIYNKILHDSLINLGCIPCKSKTLVFPKIPKYYLNHFIRGYFDGDGSINFNKPNTIKLKFVGSKAFIEGLQLILKNNLKIKPHNYKKHKNIWHCEYYGNKARKICYWMYNDCRELYLERKRERFNNHIKLRNINGKTSHISS